MGTILKDQFIFKLDSPSIHGEVFPEGAIEKVIEEYNENFVKQGKAYGELWHPDSILDLGAVINLSNASHLITKLKVEDNNLLCDVKVLETPKGKELEKLLPYCEIKPRAIGLIGMGEDGNNIVENYEIISFDIAKKKE